MKVISLPSATRRTRAIGAAAIAVVLGLVSFAAAADGPFVALMGTWSGTGTISFLSGAKERIRCNATHGAGVNSDELKLELTCASDSYKFNLRSQITHRDGAISGNWFETTRATGGAITGRIAGSLINVRAEGPTFNALLAVTTKGEKQAISIQSPGSEVSDVTITLTRKSK
jgi:hypothetical protein